MNMYQVLPDDTELHISEVGSSIYRVAHTSIGWQRLIAESIVLGDDLDTFITHMKHDYEE